MTRKRKKRDHKCVALVVAAVEEVLCLAVEVEALCSVPNRLSRHLVAPPPVVLLLARQLRKVHQPFVPGVAAVEAVVDHKC